MSAQNKLAALKAAFDKKATTSGNQDWKLFFPFWKAPDDSTSIIRFLPDLDENNSLGFLVENLQHELHINGSRKKVPCLAMFGESCPICDLARKYYDEKNDEMGKKYYRKKSYIGQCIVIDTAVEHDQSQLVKLIDFGPAVFKQIQAAFQSGDLEEAPYEFSGGYNFRIKKTKSGQYASYSTSSFAPKQTDLDDDVIQALELFNLADYRGEKIDLATVEALLVADQTGQSFSESNDDEPASEEVTAPATKPVVEAKKTEPAAESHVEPVKDSASKTSTILQQIRDRAKAAQA